jgi:PAS domain S-box-containing protein
VDPSAHAPDPETLDVSRLPLPAYVWQLVDGMLTLVDANAAAVALEAGRTDFQGMTLEELERDNPEFAGHLREAYTGQTVVVTECDHARRTDGEVRRLVTTCAWAPPATVLVHVEDVTERRRRESALAAANQRFRAAFRDSPLGKALLTTDPADPGRLVEVNDAFCRIFGYQREQIIGQVPPAGVSHPDDVAVGLEEVRRLVAGEIGSCSFEKRFVRPDGSLVTATVWVSLVDDIGTGSVLALCHFQDITESRAAEAALRASEARYRQIVETTSEGVWVVDADDRTTFVNARMAEMLGHTVEDMLGTTLAGHQADGRPPTIREKFARRPHGTAEQHEVALRRSDGSELWVSVSSDSLPSEDGEYAGALAMMSDITARKRAERELREAKDRFEGAFVQAPTGMAIVSMAGDTFGRLVEVNDALCGLLGYSQAELIGRSFEAVTHPDDAEADVALARRVATGEVPRYETEKRLVSATGDIVITNTSASITRGEDGQVLYGIAHVQDVTARQRAEADLEERDRRFRAAFSLALDAMLISDDDRRWVDGNRAAAKLLGIAVDEIPGRGLDEFSTLPAGGLERRWKHFLAAGESTGELEIRAADGEIRHVEFSARANFTPARHLLILRDVTERKRSEELREQSRRDAERLEAALHQAQKLETVGQLAGGVAHDFNNILAIILNSSEFALAELGDHPAGEDVRAVQEAARRAAALTRQLLVFSRQEIAEPQVLELNDLVGDIERLLRRTIGEHIELQVVLDPREPRVEADPSHLEQVVLNLVVNARDAMPEGGTLRLETSTVELDDAYARQHPGVKPGHHVLLAVSDTGTGMSRDVQAKAFEPFFTTKSKGMGTGLGLATTFGIVKQNGGHITLYSEEGTGTVAKVFLPVAADPSAAPTEAERSSPRVAAGERILVVEDEEGVRRVIERILVDEGYRVVLADEPETALVLADSQEFDLVLTDLVMPGMSGPQMVRRLRERRPALRALFTSGYTDRPDALPPGAVFLSKPFSRHTLLEHLTRALDEG